MEIPQLVEGLFAVLLLSAFVKITLTLSILRVGIGLSGIGASAAVFALSIALTGVSVSPYLSELPKFALTGEAEPLPSVSNPEGEASLGKDTSAKSAHLLQSGLTEFIKQNTNKALQERIEKKVLERAKNTMAPDSETRSFQDQSVLVSAFLLGELREAFEIGVLILLPFLVVDLLITNVLMSLGIVTLSPAIISFPVKVIIFLVIDGWTLMAEKLIGSYV